MKADSHDCNAAIYAGVFSARSTSAYVVLLPILVLLKWSLAGYKDASVVFFSWCKLQICSLWQTNWLILIFAYQSYCLTDIACLLARIRMLLEVGRVRQIVRKRKDESSEILNKSEKKLLFGLGLQVCAGWRVGISLPLMARPSFCIHSLQHVRHSRLLVLSASR